MITQLTVQSVLEKAIQKEIESQQLYTGMSERMIEEAAKDAFQRLSQEEQGHESLLRKYMREELGEGALKKGHVLDYKIAEHLDQPDISFCMKLEDIFLLAANREKTSHEFYLSLAEVHPPGQVRSLIEQLASQELEHKRKVEYWYTEVAFPQTAGG